MQAIFIGSYGKSEMHQFQVGVTDCIRFVAGYFKIGPHAYLYTVHRSNIQCLSILRIYRDNGHPARV